MLPKRLGKAYWQRVGKKTKMVKLLRFGPKENKVANILQQNLGVKETEDSC